MTAGFLADTLARMGGIHEHARGPSDGLAVGGAHAHAFVIDGQPVTTLPGGEHAHPVVAGHLARASGPHHHEILLPDGSIALTRMGGAHDHVPGELSGHHAHELELGGALLTSDTPAPERRPVAASQGPAAKAAGPWDLGASDIALMGDGELSALDAELHAAADRIP